MGMAAQAISAALKDFVLLHQTVLHGKHSILILIRYTCHAQSFNTRILSPYPTRFRSVKLHAIHSKPIDKTQNPSNTF